MMRFLNPNGMQNMPRSYRGTLPNGSSFRLPWDSATVAWPNYYASLVTFLQQNGVTAIPSESDVQDFICQSAPQGCIGDPNFHAPAQHQAHSQTIPCSTCGKRF